MDKIIEPLPDKTLAESGFYWREKNGVKVLVCKPLEDIGFANGFSTRLGGVSNLRDDDSSLAEESEPGAVATGLFHGDLNLAGFDDDTPANIYENRSRFLNVFDGEYRLASVWQVHGDGVKIVTAENLTDTEERFDALTSDLDGILVGVKTADCVPVLLGDQKTKSFAAVHAGWRGTAQSIVVKAVEKMQATFGTDPTNIVAAIGPAAGCDQYEIGQEVIEEFEKNFAGSDKYFKTIRPGHALIDLQLANRDQLVAAGVRNENIYTAPFCTMKRPDLFFSYRLEKSRYGKTGRLMSVIGKKG